MSNPNFAHILLTGGSGRLGSELAPLLPGIIAPAWPDELEITDPHSVAAVLDRWRPEVVVHAAAYTDVAGAEGERARCWAVNVDGTRNVMQAAAARGIFLVHISTDYVFDGLCGGYREEDPVGPVRNYYALTKLVAEAIVRCAPAHLIIRTSFRAREWPHPVAFTDVYTSQDYIDCLAPELALAIRHCREIPYAVVHIAGVRTSAYELARRRNPAVQPGSKRQAAVDLPDDCSLDTSRWQELKGGFHENTA